MIVVRFKVTCKAERAEEVGRALQAVVLPSRDVPGVLNFDIARDLTDPYAFIATEVFVDRAALARQEAQREVHDVLALLPDAVAAPPEATVYNVASSEPWGE